MEIKGKTIKLKNKRVWVGQTEKGIVLQFKKLIDIDVEKQLQYPTCSMEIDKNIVTTQTQITYEAGAALLELLLEVYTSQQME